MILNGKKIAEEVLLELKQKIDSLKTKRPPLLAYLLIGENPASHIYVKYKVKACKQIGIQTRGFELSQNISQGEVLQLIAELNLDPLVDGILVQMPLPPQINSQQVIESVDPTKDVDGFHPLNIGRLLLGYEPYFIPCTPLGIHEILLRSNISTVGKHIVIMGRSNIVGKPLAALFMQKNNLANATISLVHSYTENLDQITEQADVLIAAMGNPEFVQSAMVKNGAIVIDVGINRKDKKLVGDVNFTEVAPKASHITPVPGGVGPMTIAMLLSNTLKSYQLREQLT
ncbi:MAG: Bifunctional protein FolD protein [Chlamydiae bacterium]|nr:Bifunctional protein FolD protein [Chlamydiota bacterium]